MDRHLNFFVTYENVAAWHENQLTRFQNKSCTISCLRYTVPYSDFGLNPDLRKVSYVSDHHKSGNTHYEACESPGSVLKCLSFDLRLRGFNGSQSFELQR